MSAGITRLDPIRNHDIHERFDIAAIADKVREPRNPCSDHVLRVTDDSRLKIALNLGVQRYGLRARRRQSNAGEPHCITT